MNEANKAIPYTKAPLYFGGAVVAGHSRMRSTHCDERVPSHTQPRRTILRCRLVSFLPVVHSDVSRQFQRQAGLYHYLLQRRQLIRSRTHTRASVMLRLQVGARCSRDSAGSTLGFVQAQRNRFSRMTATPNHALQRTRAAVTPAASGLRLSPTAQRSRQPRGSLSLRSLGFRSPVL